MAAVEQGDLLKVQGIAQPVIVVSNNFFNQSGMAILCPIAQRAIPSPLHMRRIVFARRRIINSIVFIPRGRIEMTFLTQSSSFPAESLPCCSAPARG